MPLPLSSLDIGGGFVVGRVSRDVEAAPGSSILSKAIAEKVGMVALQSPNHKVVNAIDNQAIENV